MVAHPQLSRPALARRALLVALAGVVCAAAMVLSASGASARTRMCPHANAPIADVSHDGVQHAAVCLVTRERSTHHLPGRLPGRTL